TSRRVAFCFSRLDLPPPVLARPIEGTAPDDVAARHHLHSDAAFGRQPSRVPDTQPGALCLLYQRNEIGEIHLPALPVVTLPSHAGMVAPAPRRGQTRAHGGSAGLAPGRFTGGRDVPKRGSGIARRLPLRCGDRWGFGGLGVQIRRNVVFGLLVEP